MMTRKHYVAVAEIIKAFPHGSPTASQAKLIEAFADMFAQDNPRFDRGVFVEACGGNA